MSKPAAMKAMVLPMGPVTDWNGFYQSVQAVAQVPATQSINISERQSVLRDLCLSLPQALQQVRSGSAKSSSIVLYADVLTLPDAAVIDLVGQGLVIVTRRLECAGTAKVRLSAQGAQNPVFAIYALETAGSLLVEAAGQPSSVPLMPLSHLGQVFTLSGSSLVQTPQDTLQSPMLQADSVLEMSLVTTFQFATVLFDQRPDVAASMLRWIMRCTEPSLDMAPLFLQASALLALLNSAGRGAPFVPYLSRSLYSQLASAFVEASQAYEDAYHRFEDKNADLASRQQSAELMLAHYADTSRFQQALIDQTQGNLDQAMAAAQKAHDAFQDQLDKLVDAQHRFREGLIAWEHEQERQAAFAIISAILQFGLSIGMLAIGDPAGAAGAAKAVEDAAKVASTTAEIMKKLKKITEALKAVYTAGQAIYQASKTLGSAEKLADSMRTIQDQLSASEDGEESSASVFWQKFELETETQMQPAIQAKIPSASDYLKELKLTSIYGQALASTQLAVVQVGQELVRVTLQKQVSDSQLQRLKGYIQALATQKEPNAQMMQWLYSRYLDVKRSLFVAVKNYSWAYEYWALRKSSVVPSVLKSVAELKQDLANIQQDYANALESFHPAPQDFKGKVVSVTDPQVLGDLRTNYAASWPVPMEVVAFAGFDRVRAQTVRIWLMGAKVPSGQQLYLKVSNSGYYRDRLKGQSFEFAAVPLDLAFQYDPSTQQIIVDGSVAQEEAAAYSVPTPFSDWKVSIPEAQNLGVDLSGVTEVRMEFAGTLIASALR